MANRKLPFGYCMESGQICVVDDEAEIIRMIFTSYAEGNSYETLAEWLNDGKHTYSPESDGTRIHWPGFCRMSGTSETTSTPPSLHLAHSRGESRLPAES